MNYSEMEESKYLKLFHLLPSKIKLEEIIQANPPKFKYSKDFFAHLLHLTISIPARNKTLRRNDGFVPFSAIILQKKNREYRKHLDYLIENNILDTRQQYICGEQCKLYRISIEYLSDKLMEIMVKDKRLIKHIAEEYGFNFQTVKKYPHLKKWYNDKLTIDVESAIDHCYSEFCHATCNLYEKYQKACRKILMTKMIKNNLIWFTVDNFGYRLHTNLSNISSDLRPFIRYNNEPLVSIDIKNSQPYFSLLLLKEIFPLEIEENRQVSEGNNMGIMLVNKAETHTITDVLHYKHLVTNGTLYKYMEDEIRKAFGDKYFTKKYRYDHEKKEVVENNLTPKQFVKKIMFQIFFSKSTANTRERMLFKQLFPNVLKAFDDYKQKKGVAKAIRYKQLAKKLQCLESDTMLNIATSELGKLNPDMPLFTIHDCVVTTVNHKEFLEKELKRILCQVVGFSPELQAEYWTSEYTESQKAA